MDNLPSETLVKIFLSLSMNDLIAATNTCCRWRYIIEDFNLWKMHWLRLLNKAEQSSVVEEIVILRQHKVENIQNACLKLNNLLLNQCNRDCQCFVRSKINLFNYAVLKTHYSKIILTLCKNDTRLQRHEKPILILKKLNESSPRDKKYLDFRSDKKLIANLYKLFNNTKDNVGHIRHKLIIYCYPMGVSECLKVSLIRLFLERCHIEELILIPRVLMLCENLYVTDAIVIYSTSRSTEVAVVVNGAVAKGRWCEIPIGGWKLAENLNSTFQWLHPRDAAHSDRFENPNIKSMCWIKMSRKYNIKEDIPKCTTMKYDGYEEKYTLKSEQYQAAEVMYAELDLCTVIQRLLKDLPEAIMQNCLSHILLTGGNCKLKYLNIRIKEDLMKNLPEYANIITTSVHNGDDLAYTPNKELLDIEPMRKFITGQKIRLERRDYILNDV